MRYVAAAALVVASLAAGAVASDWRSPAGTEVRPVQLSPAGEGRARSEKRRPRRVDRAAPTRVSKGAKPSPPAAAVPAGEDDDDSRDDEVDDTDGDDAD